MNYSCMTMLGLLFHQRCIVETLGNKVLLETFFCAVIILIMRKVAVSSASNI